MLSSQGIIIKVPNIQQESCKYLYILALKNYPPTSINMPIVQAKKICGCLQIETVHNLYVCWLFHYILGQSRLNWCGKKNYSKLLQVLVKVNVNDNKTIAILWIWVCFLTQVRLVIIPKALWFDLIIKPPCRIASCRFLTIISYPDPVSRFYSSFYFLIPHRNMSQTMYTYKKLHFLKLPWSTMAIEDPPCYYNDKVMISYRFMHLPHVSFKFLSLCLFHIMISVTIF